MLAIPVVFYIVVFAARIPMSTLRDQGWIFDMAGVDTPFYEYFKLYGKAAHFLQITRTKSCD
jgi:SulP family sulfate permease